MQTPTDIIAAAAALSKIAEIRQLGLLESYQHLVEMPQVRSININATQATGVDMLDESKAIELEGFEKYEEFLERIIENNISSPIPKSLLADEMEMLRVCRNVPLNDFATIEFTTISAFTKEVANAIGIIPNSIIRIARDSTKVQIIDGEDKNYLAIAHGVVKSKDIIYLFHITRGRFSNQNVGATSLADVYQAASLSGVQGVNIMSCFILTPSNPLLQEDSLVPVFLQAVSRYCKLMSIGGITKKFFYHGISSTLMIDREGKLKLHNPTDSKVLGIYSVKQIETGYVYSFTYAVDVSLLKSEYRRGIFLS